MSEPTCDFRMSDGLLCGRPRGHTSWSIDAGWRGDPALGTYQPVAPGLDVSAYAHSATPQPYDAEVWPYLAVASLPPEEDR